MHVHVQCELLLFTQRIAHNMILVLAMHENRICLDTTKQDYDSARCHQKACCATSTFFFRLRLSYQPCYQAVLEK